MLLSVCGVVVGDIGGVVRVVLRGARGRSKFVGVGELAGRLYRKFGL